MVPRGTRGNGHISESTALEILDFLASQSRNIQFMAKTDQLIIKNLGFREMMLVKASLIALGAEKSALDVTDPDDGQVILSSACGVALKLAEQGIDFIGRASVPGSAARGSATAR